MLKDPILTWKEKLNFSKYSKLDYEPIIEQVREKMSYLFTFYNHLKVQQGQNVSLIDLERYLLEFKKKYNLPLLKKISLLKEKGQIFILINNIKINLNKKFNDQFEKLKKSLSPDLNNQNLVKLLWFEYSTKLNSFIKVFYISWSYLEYDFFSFWEDVDFFYKYIQNFFKEDENIKLNPIDLDYAFRYDNRYVVKNKDIIIPLFKISFGNKHVLDLVEIRKKNFNIRVLKLPDNYDVELIYTFLKKWYEKNYSQTEIPILNFSSYFSNILNYINCYYKFTYKLKYHIQHYDNLFDIPQSFFWNNFLPDIRWFNLFDLNNDMLYDIYKSGIKYKDEIFFHNKNLNIVSSLYWKQVVKTIDFNNLYVDTYTKKLTMNPNYEVGNILILKN